MQNLTPITEADLIPVFTAEIGGFTIPVVNARDLHQFLGVKRDFSNWIKKRIADYGFFEGNDYLLTNSVELASQQLQNREVFAKFGENPKEVLQGKEVFPNSGENPKGGRPVIEYILKLEMAKGLGMVENNKRGMMIRQYFIECERKIHETSQTTTQNTSQPRDEGRYIFGKAVLKRVWFWTLEKRDRIVHPGMDRNALFSITLDIRAAQINELIDDTVRFFPTSPQNDPELIKFINEWVPSFFRERANVA